MATEVGSVRTLTVQGLNGPVHFGPDISDDDWEDAQASNPICVIWNDELPQSEQIIGITPQA